MPCRRLRGHGFAFHCWEDCRCRDGRFCASGKTAQKCVRCVRSHADANDGMVPVDNKFCGDLQLQEAHADREKAVVEHDCFGVVVLERGTDKFQSACECHLVTFADDD